MQAFVYLAGGGQGPGRGRCVEAFAQGVHGLSHGQHRVAGEDLGQAIGQIANKAFSRTFEQMEGEMQLRRGLLLEA